MCSPPPSKVDQACFIVSKPRSYDPMPESRHGDVFFYLTRRPAAGVVAEPLILVGYSFAEGSQVTTTIGDSRFTFLTQGPRAFLNNPAEGPNLLAAMRAGSDMRVSGTSSRGTNVTYVFSLSGVTAGTNRTATDCPADPGFRCDLRRAAVRFAGRRFLRYARGFCTFFQTAMKAARTMAATLDLARHNPNAPMIDGGGFRSAQAAACRARPRRAA
jgi:hypothetical protein